MNIKESDIVERALETLETETGIRGEWHPEKVRDLDGVLDLYFHNGKGVHFAVEVKRELRNHNMPQILRLAATQKQPVMIVAENIFPKLKEELREQGIAYLETNGNIYVRKAPTFIWIEGIKAPAQKKEKVNRAFTKTGLKVIFLFLVDAERVNWPYREIADLAGVALGNVNYIMNGLRDEKFLARKKEDFVLLNRKQLLEKWLAAFDDKLKPALQLGNFRFVKEDDFFKWQSLKLKETTVWGGEPGGDLLTNYLKPETLTLYTTETRGELMKNYKLVPDEKGNVKAYRQFWKNDAKRKTEKHAPPILVYTDLINTANPRCVETAQKIYDQYLKDKF